MPLLDTLKSESNLELNDAFGADPFGSRVFPQRTDEMPDFNSILQIHDYAHVAAEPENKYKQQEDLIPNRMNFIYIVNPLTDFHRKETVRLFKENNPDFATTIWVDKHAYSQEQWQDLVSWASDNHIHLLDVDEVLSGRMGELEGIYHMEVGRFRPGAACDQLRLTILRLVGGGYTDMDVVNFESLGEVIAPEGYLFCHNYKRKTYNIDNAHPLAVLNRGAPGLREQINNDFMFARPNNPKINEYIQRQIQNYCTTASRLFGDKQLVTADGFSMVKKSYPKDALTLTTRNFNTAWTIAATGPGELLDMLGERAPTNHPVVDKFYFGSEISWNKKPKSVKTDATNKLAQIKLIISGLLLDLEIEPRVLRLDAYSSFDVEDNLAIALAFIGKFYSHKLNQVSSVFADNVSVPVQTLLDKNIFPALDHQQMCQIVVDNIVKNLDVSQLSLLDNPEIQSLIRNNPSMLYNAFVNVMIHNLYDEDLLATPNFGVVINKISAVLGTSFISAVFESKPRESFQPNILNLIATQCQRDAYQKIFIELLQQYEGNDKLKTNAAYLKLKITLPQVGNEAQKAEIEAFQNVTHFFSCLPVPDNYKDPAIQSFLKKLHEKISACFITEETYTAIEKSTWFKEMKMDIYDNELVQRFCREVQAIKDIDENNKDQFQCFAIHRMKIIATDMCDNVTFNYYSKTRSLQELQSLAENTLLQANNATVAKRINYYSNFITWLSNEPMTKSSQLLKEFIEKSLAELSKPDSSSYFFKRSDKQGLELQINMAIDMCLFIAGHKTALDTSDSNALKMLHNGELGKVIKTIDTLGELPSAFQDKQSWWKQATTYMSRKS